METCIEMNAVNSNDNKHGAVLQSPGILSLLILIFSMLFLTSCGGGGDATNTNTDASLSSIEISGSMAFGELMPAFGPDVTEYTVAVPYSADYAGEFLDITATATSPGAVVFDWGGIGSRVQSIPFHGLSTHDFSYTIETLAEDGVTTGAYTIHFDLPGLPNDASLSSVVISGSMSFGELTPAFSPEVTEYTVVVPYSADYAGEFLDITATATSPGAVVFDWGGIGSRVQSIPFHGLPTHDFSYIIETLASDGETSGAYTIHFDLPGLPNDASLSSVVISGSMAFGELTPAFSPDVTEYTVAVPYSADYAGETLYIAATATNPGALVFGWSDPGSRVQSIPFHGLPTDDFSYTIETLAADGVTEGAYTINFLYEPPPNADLSALSATTVIGSVSIPLKPGFSAEWLNYTGVTSYENSQITITAKVDDASSTLTVDGVVTASGVVSHAIDLIVGDNSIPVVVTASDGVTTKPYSLQITRKVPHFSVSGSVSGLTGTLILQNNLTNDLSISVDGPFVFTTTIADGEKYGVSVSSHPTGQTCSVNNASGVIAGAHVINVSVSCVTNAEIVGWRHPPDQNSYINLIDAGGGMVTAMNNNGQAVAAWIASDGSTNCGASGGDPCYQVYMSQYQDGSWSTVPDLSSNISPDGFNARSVQVAISDNGDAVIVWKMNTAWASLCNNVTFQCSRIFISEYRNGSWSHPADMNDFIDPANTSNVSLTPKVAMDSTGNTIIVWRNYGGGVYKSEYRNNAWVHPLNISDDIPLSMWNPAVSMDNNGNALIVWQSVDSAYHNRIYLSEYRNGSWTHPADLDTDAINPAGQLCPGITCSIPVKIAMDNNGNSIIVWDQRTTSYADYEDGAIYKSEYRNGAWTHPADVDDTVNSGVMTDWARYPEVAMDDSGNALIIWHQNDETLDCDVRPPGWYSTISAPCKQLFMSEYRDGSWTFPVNKSDHISLTGQPVTAIGGFLSYSVAMGNNGEAVIAWSQEIPSATCGGLTDRQVFVSEYRKGGWSHPADFSENLINLDIMTYLPKSMMDNSGNILLGWSSYTDLFFSEYRCPDCTQVLPEIIAPRNLAATAGDQQVTLSWQEVSNAHSYNIYWSTTGKATTSDNQITGITGGTYLHTALTNKTIYSYLVTAVLSSTESLPSGETSARTSACAGCEPILERTILVGTPAMDEGNAIALDVDGNVYVGGQTAGELQGTHNGSYDAFIAKYNSTGILQWTVQQGTSGLESVHDIAVDADGNSYTTGYGILLSRYNSSGDLQWFIPSDFTEATGYGIALDPAGNVYITGSAMIDLDGNTNQGGADVFISKYTAAGVLQWTVQPGTAENEQGNGIAADAEGNVYITGFTKGPLDGNAHPDQQGQEDAFISKYDTDGTLLWIEQIAPGYAHTYKEVAYAIALDSDNNVYITGYTNYRMFDNNNKGYYDVFVLKYDADGCRQWARQRGSSLFDYGYGIAVDADGNVFVTGETQEALDGNTHNGEQDIFIMKFNTKGIHGWTHQYGEANMDYGNAIAVDTNGGIYTTGATDGDLEGELNNGDGSAYRYDAFFMKHESLD